MGPSTLVLLLLLAIHGVNSLLATNGGFAIVPVMTSTVLKHNRVSFRRLIDEKRIKERERGKECAQHCLVLYSMPRYHDLPKNGKKSYIEMIQCFNLAGLVDSQSEDGVISVSLGPDMVAVTGESGTGKSLLIAKLISIVTGELSLIGKENLLETNGFPRLKVERLLQREKRLSSICKINNEVVTIKTMQQVVAPLIVVIDSSRAAYALSKPQARLSVLDCAVNDDIIREVREAHSGYSQLRRRRRKLQQDLASIPTSALHNIETDLMQHWVDELSDFADRVRILCQSLDSDLSAETNLQYAVAAVQSCDWYTDENYGMYSKLQNLRDAINEFDEKLRSAVLTRDALTASESTHSAISILENARKHLTASTANEEVTSPLTRAGERAHEQLNQVERALRKSTQIMENEQNGLIALLERIRSNVPVSIHDLDTLIADWNTLARKHSVLPFDLPSFQVALQTKLSGSSETELNLHAAKEAESRKRQEFNNFCTQLSVARQEVADLLSTAVTERLASLGMNGSTFLAELRQCFSADDQAAANGIDQVEFILAHSDSVRRGGALDVVASSGEKARILLAIECELPGAAGALCRASELRSLPPITVVYDEIDAHVGGRAGVSMAQMLAMQSGQIISITHSPSVAAIALTHLVVEKQPASTSCGVPVSVTKVYGKSRQKELARMAAGDIAPNEAERFASALLRDGDAWRKSPTDS